LASAFLPLHLILKHGVICMNILKIAAVSALFASNLISIPAMADNHSNSQTAVEAAIEAYWAARNAQDAATVAEMESRSGTLATNSDGSFHKPLTIPTAERWAKSMKAGGGITVPHFVETTELSPTIVYARYYVEGLVGGRDAPYRTRVTDVWVKEKDGKWRMKAGHFSSAAYGGTHVTASTDFED
jgi:ketosteroid isomerase-like protein